jgi:sugar lactone lactonase YvrE
MTLRFSNRSTRSRSPLLLVAATATLLGGVACSSTGPKTGSIAVTIAAPTGVTPSVTVAGGNGYSKTISASTTLTGLAPGSYTVTAASVASTNPIVGTWNTAVVSGSPVTVTASNRADSASANYTQRPGSGGLWAANFGTTHTAIQFTATQLGSSSSAAAATAVTTGVETLGAAFDANGNLWLTNFGSTSIVEYSASQLASTGTPTPAVTLAASAGSLSEPSGLAFDANGNLWVANLTGNTVVEFTASQLAASGSPTPAVTISAASGSLADPVGIAFDASGDLWVANTNGNTIVEYTPSQLSASGAPAPAVTLSATASSIVGPLTIAFDASGKLWVANGDNAQNTVVAFSTSQLAASGSPAPVVTLSANAGSLANPAGLAFDASGDLWVSNATGASIVEFSASQIASSGSPVPTTSITSASVSEPFGLAFDPHASGLPIKP